MRRLGPAPPRYIATCAMLAVLAAAAAGPARAQTGESHYTSTAEKACKVIDKAKPDDGDWITFACPGRAGYVIRVTEADLRTTVSAGRSAAAAEDEPAGSQTFPPFNRIGDTLEWRSPKSGSPYALIQRWFLSDSENPDASGRPTSFGLMVVTRLPPGPVCHVAYVDVRANPDPNALARQAADEHARAFRCGTDKVRVIGNRGRAVELAGPSR